MTTDVLMNYSYRLPDMNVRVIMSRLEIKRGWQKMGMFLIVVYIEAPRPFLRSQNEQPQKSQVGCLWMRGVREGWFKE